MKRTRRMVHSGGSAILLAAITAHTLVGQATEGSILGMVRDSSGAVVNHASVVVKNVDTGVNRLSETNETGEYVVPNLPPGPYSVTVEAPGFKKEVQPPIVLTVKARVRVDMKLEVGEAKQTVEVSSAAPMIKTDTAEVGGVVSRDLLHDAPVFDRNFMTLAGLIPGTTEGPSSARQRDFSGSAVTVGVAAEANNFIVDGVSNNMEFSGAMGVTPAIDAIQEFAIQTSQYSAEFGRSGGGVINVAMRSGTNQYHGFAYDYFRNDKLNAAPYDFTNTHPPKPPVRQNQFGSGIGMPIIHNRLFLFANYEGLRSETTSNIISSVPTGLEDKGDFSKSGFVIADPTTSNGKTRTPFPGNVIPVNRLTSSGLALVSLLPTPNYNDPSLPHGYYSPDQQTNDLDSFNIKMDANPNVSNSITGRITQQLGGRSDQGWIPSQVLGGKARLNATNAGLTYTRILSPHMVNDARAGYNHLNFGNALLYTQQTLDPATIPGLNVLSFATGYPNVTIRDYSTASAVRPIASVPNPFFLIEHSWQFMDSLSLSLDRHAIKIGGEAGIAQSNRFQGRNGGAVLSYNGVYTTPTVAQTEEAVRNGVADMLLGLASSFTTQYAFDAVRIKSHRASGFIQDDWRLRSNLTLNLGLRWDYYGPYNEEQNRFANFDPQTGIRLVPESTRSIIQNTDGLPGGILPAGWQYVPLGQVVPHRNFADFSPRFGFAYSPVKRIVMRGGVGIFYAATTANDFNNSGTEGNPFFFDFTLTGDNVNPINVQQGFPASGVAGVLAQPTFAAYYGPLNRHDPYTEKWSFNLQALASRTTAIEIGYTGQNGRSFPTVVPGNQPVPAAGTIQTRRPYPNVGAYNQYIPVNDSHYEALEFSLKQKEFHGLTAQVAFTYSKALAFADGTGNTLNNSYNFHYDWGVTGYDLRRKLVSSFVYRIPVPNAWYKPARMVLGGWNFSGLMNYRDGYPFTVGVSGPTLNNGAGTNRANLLRDPNLPSDERTLNRWFNTSAFSAPPNYVWGNQGRNMLRGPALFTTDTGLQKSFAVTESKHLIFRGEATNIMNRVQLGTPIATYNASGFGAIRSLAAGPRNLQLSLRFEF
jgi:hypothetical protein